MVPYTVWGCSINLSTGLPAVATRLQKAELKKTETETEHTCLEKLPLFLHGYWTPALNIEWKMLIGAALTFSGFFKAWNTI